MAKAEKEKVNLTTVWVLAKQPQGRWKAGLQFTPEPREVEVTDEQLELIAADPVLQVLSAPKAQADAKPAA